MNCGRRKDIKKQAKKWMDKGIGEWTKWMRRGEDWNGKRRQEDRRS